MPGMTLQTERPIFVIGCPRSGTTLLQLMLHSHPRIAIPPETRFVMAAYNRRRNFGDLRDPQNRRVLAQWIVGRKESKFHDLGLDRAAVADEILAAPGTLGSVLGVVFQAYARRFGKPRWGDKRPSYFKHVDMLRRLWPDAQFVHIIRDGRDCVASLKEMPWYKLDVRNAISAWREAIDAGRRYAARLGPDAYYELQYERLVADPAGELTKLCAFLGEEFDPAMTEPRNIATQAVPERKHHHARTKEPVTSGRVGSWVGRLEPREIALAETVLGSRLRDYGYELSGAHRPPAADLAKYATVATRRRLVQARGRLRDRWDRLREHGPVAAVPAETQAALK
jgi:LPS sulfotransferase NodH